MFGRRLLVGGIDVGKEVFVQDHAAGIEQQVVMKLLAGDRGQTHDEAKVSKVHVANECVFV